MNELSGYYRSIQKALPCSVCQKRKLMKDIRCSVDSFLQEHPDATFETVSAHFGSPQQIVDTYTEEMPPRELQKTLKMKKRIIGIITGAVAAALIIWLVFLATATSELLKDRNGYITIDLTSSQQEVQ